MNVDLDDYRWLVSEDAVPWLARATLERGQLVAFAQRLRKELSASRTHLILEQAELRQRAQEKFSHAKRLFFTRQSLEQATEEPIALYKAERFLANEPVGDLCCGIGGDLMSLAARGPASGVDLDPGVAIFAAANCRVLGINDVTLVAEDIRKVDVEAFGAWHLDPDRRSSGRRTTQLEMYEPPLAWIDEQCRRNPHVAVKLAPATLVPDAWSEQCERCWIGSRRECRQQVAWWGKLARHAGSRSVIVFAGQGLSPSEYVGSPAEPLSIAPRIGRFVFEPHAAILVASLADCLANELGLERACYEAPYFTGDQAFQHPMLDTFEVRDVLPLDVRKLNAALAALEIGDVEIKKRALEVTPEKLRKQLRLKGTNSATLIIVPTAPVRVVLAERLR